MIVLVLEAAPPLPPLPPPLDALPPLPPDPPPHAPANVAPATHAITTTVSATGIRRAADADPCVRRLSRSLSATLHLRMMKERIALPNFSRRGLSREVIFTFARDTMALSMSTRRRPLLLAAFVAALAGCSLGNIAHSDCRSDDECAAAFGAGSTCQAGYCADPPPLDQRCIILGAKDGDLVEFGAILPRTNADGTPHEWGPYWEDAIELAINELNPPIRQGIRGRPIRVTSCNTSSDPDQATELAQILVDRRVPAIISDGSSETLADATVTIKAGVLLMAGASTTPELTHLPDKSPDGNVGLVWRTTPSDVYQAQVLAKQIEMRLAPAKPTVTVFERDDTYGQGLFDAFQHDYSGTAKGYLFTPVVTGMPDDTGKAVARAAKANPTVVVVIGFPADVVPVVNNAIKNPAFKSVKWFFTQGAKFPTLFSEITDESKIEGAIGTAIAAADPKTSEAFAWFQPQFEQKYKVSTDSVADIANVFDAAMLIALTGSYALGPSQKLDGTHMANGLTHVSSGGKIALYPPNFSEAASVIDGNGDINIDGASGHLDFDNKTGEAKADIEVWEIQNKAFKHLENVTPQ
jgi:branched-chain amino acid transport system substrate-binding protein